MRIKMFTNLVAITTLIRTPIDITNMHVGLNKFTNLLISPIIPDFTHITHDIITKHTYTLIYIN